MKGAPGRRGVVNYFSKLLVLDFFNGIDKTHQNKNGTKKATSLFLI
jgi:hypothetical protein